MEGELTRLNTLLLERQEDLWKKYGRQKDHVFTARVYGENVEALRVIMCWPKVWGVCLGVIEFLGKDFVGLIGQIFSALVRNVVPELCSLWSV